MLTRGPRAQVRRVEEHLEVKDVALQSDQFNPLAIKDAIKLQYDQVIAASESVGSVHTVRRSSSPQTTQPCGL